MSKVWRKKIVINDKIFVVPIVVGVGVTTKVFYPTLKMLTPPAQAKKWPFQYHQVPNMAYNHI